MSNQRQYGPVKTEFFDTDVYKPLSHFPTFSQATGEVCPIPGLNPRANGSRPGSIGAQTGGGKLLESIDSAANTGFDLPSGSTEFKNAWASGKIDYTFALTQKAGKASAKLKIKADGMRPNIRNKFKEAAIAHKTKINDNIAFVMDFNLTKTEKNFSAFEKRASIHNQSTAKRQRAVKRRDRKLQNQLANLIPNLAFGIQIGDSDDENMILDFLKSLGILEVLKLAGAYDLKAPSLDLKLQTSEYPFVVQVSVGCKFRAPENDKGFTGLDGVVKVKLAFRPDVKWFTRIGSVLSGTRLASLSTFLVRNSKVLEVIARYGGIGARVGSRAFIVVGAVLGLIDIGRLAYHIVIWLELEYENRERLAMIAKTMDSQMASLACVIYARAYANTVFHNEMSEQERRQGIDGYNVAAELKGDENHRDAYLKIARKATQDCKLAAKRAMAQIKIPNEVYEALDKIENRSTGFVSGRLNRKFAEEDLSLRVYGQLLRMRFQTARQLANAIEKSRRQKLQRVSVRK